VEITSIFNEDASTGRTLRNIRKCLSFSLKEKYGVDSQEKIDEMLGIHGLSKDRFDVISNVEKIISSHINDSSIDANSNKNTKTVESTFQETFLPFKKAIGYDYLYRIMAELYGKKEAKKLSGEMYDMSLVIADSVSLLRPYCYAMNAQFINLEGRKWGTLYSKPSKRLSSYISALCETVHEMSNELAGAIAIGSFFYDSFYVLQLKENISLDTIKTNKDIRKYIENEFQQFVHSVNHLSRNSSESPFTNLSIFDSVKLRYMIEEMKWYFGDFETDYVVDYVMELQKIFIEFFDKGDPESNGRPYRFPVITVCLSKKVNGIDKIEDKKFLDYISKKDIYRYNIFVSEGTKIASCCRLISDTEMMEMASSVNSFGGSGLSMGSHRVVTIDFLRIALEANSLDEYYDLIKERADSASKILKAHKHLINTLADRGLQKFITNGIISMKRMFSTYGIIGLVEASEVIKNKFGNDDTIASSLNLLNLLSKEYSEKYNIIVNIEQIPGETVAERALASNKILFGNNNQYIKDYKLLSNQFVPLWKEASIFERLEIDGKYNRLITGGGIVHAQIGERVTPTQAKEIITFAVEKGCEHFALNAIYSQCKNNHNHFGKLETCPVCGESIVEWFTRVVGFFVPVSSWIKTRRDWEFNERKFI